MYLIVDANRVFSALLSKGNAFAVFLLNNVVKEFDLISPEFLFFEVGKHLDEVIEKSSLPPEELGKVFRFVKSEIEFMPLKEFNKHAGEAEKLSPHGKDAQYFALSLALNGAIWSDEKAFKSQSKVKIFNTDELIGLLCSRFDTLTG